MWINHEAESWTPLASWLVLSKCLQTEGKKMDSQLPKDGDFLINDARAVVKYAESVRQICAGPGYFCTQTGLIGMVRVGAHC